MSVLYDAPGPKTRRRHLIGGIVGGLVVAAVIGLIVWKLDQEGQFTDAYWAPFQNSGVWKNTCPIPSPTEIRISSPAASLLRTVPSCEIHA